MAGMVAMVDVEGAAMTERQAWQKLAWGVRVGRYGSGLCLALEVDPDFRGQPLPGIKMRMLARIEAIPKDGGWVWPRDEAGNKLRAAYCDRQVARLTRKRAAPKKARR